MARQPEALSQEQSGRPAGASFARVPEFTCQAAGCCQVFDSLENYEHHYHTLHRNVCSFCGRAFPSVHLLDVHILEWHDSLFQILSERQDMVGAASASAGPSAGSWGGGGGGGCRRAVCLGPSARGSGARRGPPWGRRGAGRG